MSDNRPVEQINNFTEPQKEEVFDPFGFNDVTGAVPSRDLMFRMQDRMRVQPIQLSAANASMDLGDENEDKE